MPEPQSRALRTQTFFKMQEIARWQALGQSIEQIAVHMNMTPETVSRLANHKTFKDVQAKIAGRMYEGVDTTLANRKANVMLEEAAPQAAEALIMLLGEGFAADKRQTATAILDRAGFGPIQKRAIRQRIEFDPVTMGILRLALLETAQGVDDFDDGDDDADGGAEGWVEGAGGVS